MYDYQTHLMLNVIKVLLGCLCRFVLIKTERAGTSQIPRVLCEQSAYQVVLQPGEGASMKLALLHSSLCWSITAVFPTVIFHATVGFRSWQGSADRLCKFAARHWYTPSRRGTGSGQATSHHGCPCRPG